MLFTAAMLRSLEPDVAEKLCSEGLRFPPTRAALVKQILALAPRIASSVEKGLSNSQLYEALSEAPVEALVFAVALRPELEFKEVLAHYLQNLRHVKLQVSGGDFVSMGYKPGPALGAALRDALHQKLEGRLKGRKEEMEYVLKKLSEAEVQVAD
jgi:tRNA nucleotidyltransferase/poly(A) polymerase